VSSSLTNAEGYEPFAAFLTTILKSERAEPDLIAQAFATHLASIDPVRLPKAAQPVWATLVTKLLKAPADKVPLPPRAIAGIGSWPMARVGELISAVRTIEAEIARTANDNLADETNARVSKAYL
jgi:hypothetical protein